MNSFASVLNRCLRMRCSLLPRSLPFALVVICLSTGSLLADPRDEEIRQLRAELEDLKERLERLEAAAVPEPAGPPAPREDPREPSTETVERAAAPVIEMRDNEFLIDEPADAEGVTLRGALRFNAYLRNDDSSSRDRKGESGFELFRIGISGVHGNFLSSAEYRFYPYMDVLHHGWIGYDFEEQGQLQVGVSQVPFGILPYASHNYWFGIPYYLGLADNYELGLKYLYEQDVWNLQFAFYKNSEVDATSLNRYAFDVVRVGEQQNEAINQFNLRMAYSPETEGDGTHEFGVSTRLGELYNHTTGRSGHHWAIAGHWDGRIQQWNLQLQLARFEYSPKNPAGVSDRIVQLGALASAYEVASSGTVAVANIAYNVPLTMGILDQLILYNDFSIFFKDESAFRDSKINTIGAAFGMGPLFIYLDWIHGYNVPYFEAGSLAGEGEDSWKSRLNLNMGYYW